LTAISWFKTRRSAQLHDKHRTLSGSAAHRDGAAMRLNDTSHYRQTKTGTASTPPITAPEPLEDHIVLFNRHSGAFVTDRNGSVVTDRNFHGSADCGMCDRVLRQITDGYEKRLSITLHPYGI
jgi:hypothetical protein